MEQIFSFGERWNVPFNSASPCWMEHFIFHLMKIFVPLHSETFIICILFAVIIIMRWMWLVSDWLTKYFLPSNLQAEKGLCEGTKGQASYVPNKMHCNAWYLEYFLFLQFCLNWPRRKLLKTLKRGVNDLCAKHHLSDKISYPEIYQLFIINMYKFVKRINSNKTTCLRFCCGKNLTGDTLQILLRFSRFGSKKKKKKLIGLLINFHIFE